VRWCYPDHDNPVYFSHGVRALRDDGLEKARAGITTLEEVMRAVSVDPV